VKTTLKDGSDPNAGSWLAQNGSSLVVTIIMIALVFMYLNVVDVMKVVAGLGLVIFIHELGHFAAAKWCNVYVETFSIGFGPSIPGCRFKYGETTYMVAMIPLGGYVKMMGEGENKPEGEEDEPDDTDPRSFRNKTVGQRMLIISAGVIMNILLAAICFVIVYMHGVDERPATLGRVETASAAWQAGLHSGERILQIEGKRDPMFADIQPRVMSTGVGEKVHLVVENPDTKEQRELDIEPLLDGEGLFPMLGIGPQQQLLVFKSNRPGFVPTRPGSAASKAQPPFQQGDRIVGLTDPIDPTKVTALAPDPLDPSNNRKDYADYLRRIHKLRDREIVYQVIRDGQDPNTPPVDLKVPPEYTLTFGMRMQMGEVASIRADSPATKAKLVGKNPPDAKEGIQARKVGATPETDTHGDKLIQVEIVEADGSKTRFVPSLSNAKEAGVTEKLLDPLKLAFELDSWAARQSKHRTVALTVLRLIGHKEEHVHLETEYDAEWQLSRETVNSPTTPCPVGGLGLAYYVETVVDDVEPGKAAEKAGILKGDVIEQIRPYILNEKKELREGRWIELKSNQWAFVFFELQITDSPQVTLRIKRGEGEPIELNVTAEPDTSWTIPYRGVYLRDDIRVQKAEGILEALGMGANRTYRTIKLIYQNLTAMLIGRVSAYTMSGPLTIASVSYSIAGENVWQFILFIGMISVNLAVVNFLPIPVLDGGHMVFLIYEKIVGKPAPERLQIAAMFIGLAMILSLMVFVIFLDVKRLFF